MMTQALISFQQIFTPASKQDSHLLVENSSAVYNLWYQWWVPMTSDDTQSTVLEVNFFTLQLLKETQHLYETDYNSR